MVESEKQMHPIVKGIAAVAAFVLIAEILVWFMPPAWAAVAIPVTEHLTINLGDLPQWIIALVAAGGLWKAWKAEKAAVAIKTDLGTVKEDVKLLERNTNSLTTQLKEAALVTGRREGVVTGKQAGVDAAEQLAEGRRQGKEEERASVAAAAKVTAPNSSAPVAADGKAPLPVADDRTAVAGERVADATERSAEAQQRVASAAEEKK